MNIFSCQILFNRNGRDGVMEQNGRTRLIGHWTVMKYWTIIIGCKLYKFVTRYCCTTWEQRQICRCHFLNFTHNSVMT